MNSANMNPSQQEPKRPRSRFTRHKVAGMRLEERDEQLLCDLFLQRAMSRSQIEELHFTSTVRCNARMRQLFDHAFVERYYPPAAPFGAQAIYTVGKAALPLVSRRLEMELPEVARFYRSGRTPTFIEHTLAIVDVWLAFRRAAVSAPGVEIDLWLSELQCRHEWEIRATAGGGWKKETFKPDGFVRLLANGRHHSFFVEVDLGHTSSKQFANKLFTHSRYLESGLFEETYGAGSFNTVVVTTSKKRVQNLRLISGGRKNSLFQYTTQKDLTDSGPLTPIWWRNDAVESSLLY